MSYSNEKPILLNKNSDKGAKEERLRRRLELASLKDMPLEARRKEAREPLFLTRYE